MICLKALVHTTPCLSYTKAFLLEVLKSGQIKINSTNLDFSRGFPSIKLPFGVFLIVLANYMLTK